MKLAITSTTRNRAAERKGGEVSLDRGKLLRARSTNIDLGWIVILLLLIGIGVAIYTNSLWHP